MTDGETTRLGDERGTEWRLDPSIGAMGETGEKSESRDVAIRALTWGIVAVALIVLIAATIFLVQGLMDLIAVVSPILVAAMLLWLVLLSVRNVQLERRLDRLERKKT